MIHFLCQYILKILFLLYLNQIVNDSSCSFIILVLFIILLVKDLEIHPFHYIFWLLFFACICIFFFKSNLISPILLFSWQSWPDKHGMSPATNFARRCLYWKWFSSNGKACPAPSHLQQILARSGGSQANPAW